jgi:hypothetical protein
VFFDVQLRDGGIYAVMLGKRTVRAFLNRRDATHSAYLGNVALRDGQADDDVIAEIQAGKILTGEKHEKSLRKPV